MADAIELKGDGALLAEGWERRSILDEPRLSEVVEMYRDLGFEVKVVDLKPEMLAGCDTCIVGPTETYKVVYTRGGPTVAGENKDLF